MVAPQPKSGRPKSNVTSLPSSPTPCSLSHRVIACDGSTYYELKKKQTAEIAKEAKAFHAARKKNAGSRKPKKVEEPPCGRWQQLDTLEWRVAHTSALRR